MKDNKVSYNKCSRILVAKYATHLQLATWLIIILSFMTLLLYVASCHFVSKPVTLMIQEQVDVLLPGTV